MACAPHAGNLPFVCRMYSMTLAHFMNLSFSGSLSLSCSPPLAHTYTHRLILTAYRSRTWWRRQFNRRTNERWAHEISFDLRERVSECLPCGK